MLNNIMEQEGISLVVGAPMLTPDPRYTADFIVNGILKYMYADKARQVLPIGVAEDS